jgi:hypothetical protein
VSRWSDRILEHQLTAKAVKLFALTATSLLMGETPRSLGNLLSIEEGPVV